MNLHSTSMHTMKRNMQFWLIVAAALAVLMPTAVLASDIPASHASVVRTQFNANESSKREALLLNAVEQNDTTQAAGLLRKHVSPNAAKADGTTALHWAAYNDNVALAKQLLQVGANPNACTRLRNATPLHMAAEIGDGDLIEVLLKAGAKADAVNETGTTPLMIASASGSTAAVNALLSHGADVNVREKTYGETALFFAAAHDRAAVVTLLLSKGADPKITTSISKLERVTVGVNGEVQDDKKKPEQAPTSPTKGSEEPDRKAAEGGKQTKPALKAEDKTKTEGDEQGKPTAKADDRTKDAYGLSAVDRKKRVYGTLQLGGMTALLIAARDGQQGAVKALLDAHDDINQTSGTDHATALILALINGHYDLAKTLLDRGADPKLTTSDGITPLYALLDVQWAPHTWYPQPVIAQEHIAYLDLAKTLLDRGADPNAAIKKKLWYRVFANDETWFELEGATPFLRAAIASDVSAMNLLVQHGADPNLKTASGDTPLMAAAGVGWAAYWTTSAPYSRLDAVRYCLDHGAELKVADVKGYTALHGAAFRGDDEMVKYLISLGADVHARTKDGDTVADLANGLFEHALVHPETVALLEKMGSANSHNCRSNECVVPAKEDKPAAVAKADQPASAQAQETSKEAQPK